MSNKVTSVYVLAFDIGKQIYIAILNKCLTMLTHTKTLKNQVLTRILDFSEAQEYLNTCTEMQEPEIDTCWWKLVYVLGKEGQKGV